MWSLFNLRGKREAEKTEKNIIKDRNRTPQARQSYRPPNPEVRSIAKAGREGRGGRDAILRWGWCGAEYMHEYSLKAFLPLFFFSLSLPRSSRKVPDICHVFADLL